MRAVAVALMALALLAGCTKKTEYGPCIGAFDERDPRYVYKISVWNTILGILFVETIVVPVVIVVDQIQCPEWPRDPAPPQPEPKGQSGE